MFRKLITNVVLLVACCCAADAQAHHRGWYHHYGYYPATHVSGLAVHPAYVAPAYVAPAAVGVQSVHSLSVAPLAFHSYGIAPLHVASVAAGGQSVQSAGQSSSSVSDIIAIIKLLREVTPAPGGGGGGGNPAPNPDVSDLKTRMAALESRIKKIETSLTDMRNQLNSSARPGAGSAAAAANADTIKQLQADIAKIKQNLKIK